MEAARLTNRLRSDTPNFDISLEILFLLELLQHTGSVLNQIPIKAFLREWAKFLANFKGLAKAPKATARK